jgi:hypothetical protein
MTSNPFGSGELGRTDPELDRVAQQLERYAADAGAQPPLDLATRIRDAVDREPVPGRGVMHWLRLHSRPLTAAAAAAAVVAVVAGAIAIGQLAERTQEQVGTSPSPAAVPTLTPAPTHRPTPTPSSSPTPTPSPSESPSPSPTSSESAAPSATDDHGGAETPQPSESDDGGGSENSGPGGGSGSGSGSGDSP